ncbi:hypothetical protein [Alkalihalobacillus sp. TS-13]|uniref:hypothetical protein n=1 Tax=Alkalihalobacillus sp. TS-13 TaxID=2842455 RepID=UPI001C879406|nr:hypothetical protein [Alkalihalobacillus sp. TS-13]
MKKEESFRVVLKNQEYKQLCEVAKPLKLLNVRIRTYTLSLSVLFQSIDQSELMVKLNELIKERNRLLETITDRNVIRKQLCQLN